MLSVCLIVAGFANLQTAWWSILIGLPLLGLVTFAGYQTHFFQNWVKPNGGLAHPVVRWLGPIALILMVIFMALMIQAFLVALRSSFEDKK